MKRQPTLTPMQHKFINAVLETISKDEELIRFTQTFASGKTFALKALDEIFDERIERKFNSKHKK